jgi:glycosyltransferase involved in cell wall biosynthesis
MFANFDRRADVRNSRSAQASDERVKTAGDCPNFAESSEQNGTVPFSEAVLKRPLNVMFIITSMPVGGAETLLVNLVRRLDRQRFKPEICCLKEPGPLGEMIVRELPVHHGLLGHKYDLRIWPRLVRLLRERQIDAVVTVGAGDKMFWGRLAARRVGVPVILSALHSTGWPDGIGRLNRLLTPITDAFIAVADSHGAFLITEEHLPADKVVVIPNGVDTATFAAVPDTAALRRELEIGLTDPVVSIVAALRPEKNHELFLEVARRVIERISNARFLIIGDGPLREPLEKLARELGVAANVRFLGSRDDVPRLLSLSDVFALTSHNEASPVSILEAMSVGRPVVAVNVGSIREVVSDGRNGFLAAPGDAGQLAERIVWLIENPIACQALGAAARRTVVDGWSIDAMVRRYEGLIARLFARKRSHIDKAPDPIAAGGLALSRERRNDPTPISMTSHAP